MSPADRSRNGHPGFLGLWAGETTSQFGSQLEEPVQDDLQPADLQSADLQPGKPQ